MKKNLLTSVLPEDVLIAIVSRLDLVDACTLRLVSKSWRSRISLGSVKKLRRRSPFVVFSHVISDFSMPGLFIDDDADEITLAGGAGKKFRARNLVFNHRADIDDSVRDYSVRHYSASCRGLMCFYSDCQLYVYSPSTNRFLPLHRDFDYKEFKIGIVYIASKNHYKIVLLELIHDGNEPDGAQLARFTATTVHVEDEHGGVVTTKKDDFFGVGEDTSWEFIREHALPPHRKATLGNLIGVDGAAYSIIDLGISPGIRRKVISLDLEGFARQQLKIFNLPNCCEENGKCSDCCETDVLSEVKDRLCYPHQTPTYIDLWLLKDRNSCSWFKGFTFSYIPTFSSVGPVFYFPCSTAASNDDAGNNTDAGLILFGDQFVQYDMRNKEVTTAFPDHSSTDDDRFADSYTFQVVADRPFSLKNGFKCTSLPTDMHSLEPTSPLRYDPPPTKSSPPPPPPPPPSLPPLTKISPPPPQYIPPELFELYRQESNRRMLHTPPPPQIALPQPPGVTLPPPQISLPHSPQTFLPSAPSYSHTPLPHGSLPPPSYSRPPHTQGSLPPPPPSYSHPPLPQGPITPPPPPYSHHPLPQGSIPPPQFFYHNLQQTTNWKMPHPPPTRGFSPPLNPQNFQGKIYSSEVKKRKVDS